MGEKRKRYHKAYDYLRKRIRFLDYCEYRRNHLPIGSGQGLRTTFPWVFWGFHGKYKIFI